MGRDALSLEEVAVLLGESSSPTGRSNEAEDLRRRLAAVGKPPDEASDALAATAATKRAVDLLDDWPWPPRLAARLAGAWSELLRTEVAVSVLYVEATTFGGFLLRAHLPSFLATATAPGGSPVLAAEIPLPLVGSALRRMLGGPIEESAASEQGLTPLEQRLGTRLIACLVADSLAITHDPASTDAIPLTVHNQLPHVTPTWSRTPAVNIQFRVAYGPVAGLLDGCVPRACVPWAT